MNQILKGPLIGIYIKLQNIKFGNHKGIMSLLKYYGTPE